MRSCSHAGGPSRTPDRSQTQDPQCDHGGCPPALYIVGIGPGSIEHLSIRARKVLEQAEIIVGYTTYVDLIRPLIRDREVISTGMTKEVHRVNKAIDTARKGQTVALVSSGDSGIYAMAGLVWELCQARDISIVPVPNSPGNPAQTSGSIAVEVVPGIPALCAGAALLGAPLTHDFAVISLSDLLTPWEIIEKRLSAAAQADFVMVIYNPGSKKRTRHLGRAQELIIEHRDGHTPVGIVTGAMRPNQAVRITCLNEMHHVPIDMQTIVFVGNSTTRQAGDFLYTLRGYGGKYDIGSNITATDVFSKDPPGGTDA